MDTRTPEQINRETQLFAAMIKDCCRLTMWCYSPTGALLDTTSPEYEDFLLPLAASGCMDPIFEHIDDFEAPVLVCDAIGLLWSVNRLREEADPSKTACLILLGPASDGSFGLADLQSATKRLKLEAGTTQSIVQALDQVPSISQSNFYQYIRMLHRILTGEVIESGDVKVIEADLNTQKDGSERFSDPERAIETEERLLQMIREGTIDFGRIAGPLIENTPRDNIITTGDLREQKDAVIVFTTLAARAAREGGVAAGTVLELRARYIREVEQCRRVSELMTVNNRMVDDFVNQVREAHENKDVSRVVRACLEYIRLHVTEPFDLHEMADTLGYSDYYLSKKFAKETGEKISTKLRMARLERARLKLANTNETIQSISDELQFSSRNYFSKVFYETYGVTPREYREQYGLKK